MQGARGLRARAADRERGHGGQAFGDSGAAIYPARARVEIRADRLLRPCGGDLLYRGPRLRRGARLGLGRARLAAHGGVAHPHSRARAGAHGRRLDCGGLHGGARAAAGRLLPVHGRGLVLRGRDIGVLRALPGAAALCAPAAAAAGGAGLAQDAALPRGRPRAALCWASAASTRAATGSG